MTWPFELLSVSNDHSGVLSFCATESGTVTLTDCPLGDEPSSSCQRTAWGQREPVTWRVCCVPRAGLMINTLRVTWCLLDLRATTGCRKQVRRRASHPKPLPLPLIPLLLRCNARYKKSSPSLLMIQLKQEAEIVLNSPENWKLQLMRPLWRLLSLNETTQGNPSPS